MSKNFVPQIFACLAFGLLAMVVAPRVSAATCTFGSVGTSDFNTAANWTCGVSDHFVPGSTSTAIIPSGTSTTLGASTTLGNLTISSTAVLTTTGFNLTVNDTATTTGSFVAGGSTITIGRDFNVTGSGTFNAGTSTLLFSTSTDAITYGLNISNASTTIAMYNWSVSSTGGTTASQLLINNFVGGTPTVNALGQWILNSSLSQSNSTITITGTSTIGTAGTLLMGTTGHLVTLNGTTTNSGIIRPGFASSAKVVFNNAFTNSATGQLNGGSTSDHGLYDFANSWTNSGSFTGGSSTVSFIGTIPQTIPSGLTFWNLNSSSTGSTVTLGGNATTTNDLFLYSGNFALGANTLNLGGNYTRPTGPPNFVPGTGTLRVNGTGSQSINSDNYYNVTVSKPSGTVTMTASGISSQLLLQSGTLAITGGSGLTLSGTGVPFLFAGGTFVPGTSTITYNSAVGATVASTTYNNLAFAPITGAPTYTLAASTTASGTLDLNSSSTLAVGANTFHVTGLITNAGLITETSGSIIHPLESLVFVDSLGATQTGYSTPGTVYVQVQDSNRNLNGASAESITIPVSLNAAAGSDSETLTLTETGAATGIFRSGTINLVNSSAVSVGNSQFEITGSGLGTSSYTDVQDGADTSSTTATVTYNASNTGGGTSGGGGGGGGLGSAGTPSLPPVTTNYQTYLNNLKNIGVPVHALLKLPDDGNANTQEDTAVYYVGADGMRHAFPNSKVYFTWYSDFSQVQLISITQLATIPLGKNVTYKPGVKMVKFTTLAKVYVVAKGGVLRWITSEAAATALYGSSWNTNIDDISDTFYSNYSFGTDVSGLSDFNPAAVTASVSVPSDSLQM